MGATGYRLVGDGEWTATITAAEDLSSVNMDQFMTDTVWTLGSGGNVVLDLTRLARFTPHLMRRLCLLNVRFNADSRRLAVASPRTDLLLRAMKEAGCRGDGKRFMGCGKNCIWAVNVSDSITM